MSETQGDLMNVAELNIDLEKYANGEKTIDFLILFNGYPIHHDPANFILRDIISGFESEIRQLQNIDDYPSRDDLKKRVVHISSVVLSILVKPFGY